MSETTNIKLPARMAQMLLSASTKVRWPARLGSGFPEPSEYDLVWSDKERSEHMLKIAALRSELREKYCAKIGNQYCVGENPARDVKEPLKNWIPKPGTVETLEMVDPDLELSIDLSWSAHHAIYWLCLWMVHPASPAFVEAGLYEEYVLPTVRVIDQWDDLMYDLGIREEKPPDEIPARGTLTPAPIKKGANGH